MDENGIFNPTIIDSGTQTLVLPIDEPSDPSVLLNSSLIISFGDVNLELDNEVFSTLLNANSLGFDPTSPGTLGFPIFWLYNILHEVNQDRNGTISFYKRENAKENMVTNLLPTTDEGVDHEEASVTGTTGKDSVADVMRSVLETVTDA